MRTSAIILLVMLTSVVLSEQREESRDLETATDEDPEQLGRGRRKRKKHQQQQQQQQYTAGGGGGGPCSALGLGRTFGDKLFGWSTPAQTYVSAPVYNYYIGCGGGGLHHAPPQPFFPAPAPAPYYPPQPFPGHHHHHHNHNHGHHGGGGGGFNQYQGPAAQPYHDEAGGAGGGYPQRPPRPVASVVSAAASGLGTALADYVTGGTRPKKTYKQINKAVNQLFRPIYKLF